MIAVAVALVVPASAGAVVRKVSFTGTVSPNDYANLTVRVAPKSRCTITVIMTEQGETAERDNGSRDDAVGIGNWERNPSPSVLVTLGAALATDQRRGVCVHEVERLLGDPEERASRV